MATSRVGVTPGSGEFVATYEVMEGGEEKHIQRTALNDQQGADLSGRRGAATSLPVVLSTEDLAVLQSLQAGRGWVDIPASGATALSTPVREVVIVTAGNLQVEAADASVNATAIAVTPGMRFSIAAVRKGPLNTAAIIGVK